MTLELKRYKSDFFNNSTEPYRLSGVKSITNNTIYGEGHFAITIYDTMPVLFRQRKAKQFFLRICGKEAKL